jgi:hypothetical protein
MDIIRIIDTINMLAFMRSIYDDNDVKYCRCENDKIISQHIDEYRFHFLAVFLAFKSLVHPILDHGLRAIYNYQPKIKLIQDDF